MDTEIWNDCKRQAEAELSRLTEAYENDTLCEVIDSMINEGCVEIKCDIKHNMSDFEYMFCGGGPTGTFNYNTIEVSWGSAVARVSIPKEIGDAVWEYTEEVFDLCRE